MGVDPKVFFANERTYLHWLNVAVTLGSIGSGMIGFAGVGDKDGEGGLATLRVRSGLEGGGGLVRVLSGRRALTGTCVLLCSAGVAESLA
jgi:hypothetical protein